MNTTAEESTIYNAAMAIAENGEQFDVATDIAMKQSLFDKMSSVYAVIGKLLEEAKAAMLPKLKEQARSKIEEFAKSMGLNADDFVALGGYVPAAPESPKTTQKKTPNASSQTQKEKAKPRKRAPDGVDATGKPWKPNAKYKVHEYLAIDNHDNFKRGFTGTPKGKRPDCLADYVKADNSLDYSRFYKVIDQAEIAAMQKLVDDEQAAYMPRGWELVDRIVRPKVSA